MSSKSPNWHIDFVTRDFQCVQFSLHIPYITVHAGKCRLRKLRAEQSRPKILDLRIWEMTTFIIGIIVRILKISKDHEIIFFNSMIQFQTFMINRKLHILIAEPFYYSIFKHKKTITCTLCLFLKHYI